MTTRFRLHLLSLLALLCLVARGEEARLSTVYQGKVSALALPATALGDDWLGPSGLVVDDFADLSPFTPEVKAVVEDLRQQMVPLGVIATADFTYRRKSDPRQALTLKVFIFKDAAANRDWWTKKYQYAGWEKHYKVVPGLPYDALDSTQVAKRIAGFGNLWLTCGGPEKSTDHLTLLNLFIARLTAAPPTN